MRIDRSMSALTPLSPSTYHSTSTCCLLALSISITMALATLSGCDDEATTTPSGGAQAGAEPPLGGAMSGDDSRAGDSGAGEAGGMTAGGSTGGEGAGMMNPGGELAGDAVGGDLAGDAVGGDVAGDQIAGERGGEMTIEDTCYAERLDLSSPPLEQRLSDPRGEVTVSVEGEGCTRRFSLTSTAPRRDQLPENPLLLNEVEGRPSLHTHNPLTDALYQLAMVEAEACSVDAISDGAFRRGEPLPCEAGGCFETGEKWTYVWTRDTAYSVDLGLALLDPIRSANSLRFKLSSLRGGGGTQIVQDTGSGGSYPISTDRSVWAIGARAALSTLHGEALTRFEVETYEAVKNTIAHDLVVAFDERDGLYRGEQSFLDWREQSYPDWVAEDVVHLGMSKALSTNVGHYALLDLASALAGRAGDQGEEVEYRRRADELKSAIRSALWLEDVGLFSTFISTTLDPAPSRRYDLLGNALAIMTGVATPEQAQRIISAYPLSPHGPAVQWPQLRDIPIYHNRGIWPFVTAYALRAARLVGHAEAVNRLTESLINGAALNLSNMENLDAGTGLAYAEEGSLSGPVVNSQRQLWSVAGSVGLFHELLWGLKPALEGLIVDPWVTEYARQTLFGGSARVSLVGLPWRGATLDGVMIFPEEAINRAQELSGASASVDTPVAWVADLITLDGASLTDGIIPREVSADTRLQLVITMRLIEAPASAGLTIVDPSDSERYYAPRAPRIINAQRDVSGVVLSLDLRGEGENAQRSMNVYRDGQLIATEVALAPSWTDESAPAEKTLCYTFEVVSQASNNHSQRAQPWCVWSEIEMLYAGDFTAQGGTRVDQYDRIHYQGWGAPSDTLSIDFTASRGGEVFVQAEYGNGAGAINTGVTCAVKRIDLIELPSERVISHGYLMMPHLGRWDRWSGSNFIPMSLTEGARYRLLIHQDAYAINMSAFEHFTLYTGGFGGEGGTFNDVNISALKVLYLE